MHTILHYWLWGKLYPAKSSRYTVHLRMVHTYKHTMWCSTPLKNRLPLLTWNKILSCYLILMEHIYRRTVTFLDTAVSYIYLCSVVIHSCSVLTYTQSGLPHLASFPGHVVGGEWPGGEAMPHHALHWPSYRFFRAATGC